MQETINKIKATFPNLPNDALDGINDDVLATMVYNYVVWYSLQKGITIGEKQFVNELFYKAKDRATMMYEERPDPRPTLNEDGLSVYRGSMKESDTGNRYAMESKPKAGRKVNPSSPINRVIAMYAEAADKSRATLVKKFKDVLGIADNTAVVYYYRARAAYNAQ